MAQLNTHAALEALGQHGDCVGVSSRSGMLGGRKLHVVSVGLVFSFPLSVYMGCHCARVTDLGYAIIKWGTLSLPSLPYSFFFLPVDCFLFLV